jgi:hypothetical protein
LSWSDQDATPSQPDTWTQPTAPVAGAFHLRRAADSWLRQALKQRVVGRDGASAPLPAQADPYIQPVQGTRALRTARDAYGRRVLITQLQAEALFGFNPFTNVPAEFFTVAAQDRSFTVEATGRFISVPAGSRFSIDAQGRFLIVADQDRTFEDNE